MRTFKRILFLIDIKNKKKISVYFFLLFITSVLELATISAIFPFVQILLGEPLPVNLEFINIFLNFLSEYFSINILSVGLLSLIIIFLFKNFFLLFFTWFNLSFGASIQTNLAQKFFTFYLNQKYYYFVNKNSSEVIRNLYNEILNFHKIFNSFLDVISETVIFISILFLLIFYYPDITFMFLIIFGLFGFCMYFFSKKKLGTWGKIRINLSAKYLKNITEVIRSIKEIIIYKKNSFFEKLHFKQKKTLTSLNKKFGILNVAPKLIFEILIIIGLCGIIYFLNSKNYSNNEIISILSIYAVAIYRIMPSLSKLLVSFQNINFRAPSVDILYDEIFSNKLEKIETENFYSNNDKKLDFKKEIIIKDLSFSYEGSKNKILNDINFKINKGDFLGIIGSSGSGKTTLINIIIGLIQSEQDSIFVDGKNIKNFSNSWMKKFSYVPQNVFLNDCSIKDNIAFAENNLEIDNESLLRAIKFSKIQSFVDNLSNGLDTNVGEMGLKFSGGQIQRILIARALYFNPEILVLDEATSGLDEKIENEILEDISKNKEDLTIIIISHRKNSLNYCNKIYDLSTRICSDKKINIIS